MFVIDEIDVLLLRVCFACTGCTVCEESCIETVDYIIDMRLTNLAVDSLSWYILIEHTIKRKQRFFMTSRLWSLSCWWQCYSYGWFFVEIVGIAEHIWIEESHWGLFFYDFDDLWFVGFTLETRSLSNKDLDSLRHLKSKAKSDYKDEVSYVYC